MTRLLALLEPVLQPLQWLCLALSVFLIVRMLLTYRQVHAVSRRSCVIGIVFPVLILGAYAAFLGSDLPDTILAGLFALGAAGGAWQGRNTRVWSAAGRPMAQNTFWFLVVWAASFILGQALVALGSSLRFNLGIGAISLTTGIAVGAQAYVLARLSTLPAGTRGPTAMPAPASESVDAATGQASGRFCTRCGSRAVAGDRFCRQCGAAMEPASIEPAAPA